MNDNYYPPSRQAIPQPLPQAMPPAVYPANPPVVSSNPSRHDPSQEAPQEQVEKTARKLHEVVRESRTVLMTATTVFPFTLFPDTVTIDREKLTITHRTFFMVAEVMSIRIEDILNITANVGPIFGSVKISTRFFNAEKPYEVNFFWRKDALRIKRIMQGYIIAIQEKVDCSALTTKQLADMLDKLGQAAPGEET